MNTDMFQKALHSLWSICGKRRVLPRSYILSERVLRKGRNQLASGGFANVWMGELVEKNFCRRNVCLKAIKVATKEGETGRKDSEKVRDSPFFWAGLFT